MIALDTPRLNEMFALLTHPYRRYVLYYLTKESEAVDIDTLVTAVAKWDGDRTRTDRIDDRTDIEIALHHSHLPKLADAGVITRSANGKHVELRELGGIDQFLVETAPVDGYRQTATGD